MPSVFSGYWNSASPAAGTVLTTWTPGNIGTYLVSVHVYSTGIVTNADDDNIGLYQNANLIATLPMPSSKGFFIDMDLYLVVNATDTISVRVIANASNNAVYRGLLTGKLENLNG
jgi:hypothetical protein